MTIRAPSNARLQELLKVDQPTAEKIRAVLKAENMTPVRPLVPDLKIPLTGLCFSYKKLMAIDHLAGNHGVEAIRTENTEEWAEYSNSGDTYNGTVILFRGRFHFTDLGTFLETSRVKFK